MIYSKEISQGISKISGMSYLDYSPYHKYLDSYIIILGGVVLIILGLYWGFRLYVQSYQESRSFSSATVDQQIAANIMKAKSPLVGAGAVYITQPNRFNTGEETTAPLSGGDLAETTFLPNRCDATELLVQHTREGGNEVTTDLDDTEYLVEE